jgi:membrane protein implicated in regulation of membrane protease activity
MNLSDTLILLGLLAILGEFFLPAGIVGVLGIGLLVAGGLISYGVDANISFAAGATATIVAGAAVWFYSKHLNKSKPIKTGGESVVGMTGKVTQDFKNGKGLIDVKGESWSARSMKEKNYKAGQKVEVAGFEGVYLKVK